VKNGYTFQNLGNNERVQVMNAMWTGVWQASIQADKGGGLYDCLWIRFNTLLFSVPTVGYRYRAQLYQFLQGVALYEGAPPLSDFPALAPDFRVGDVVLLTFRDQRRDWPMILGPAG